MGSEVSLEGVK